MIREIACPRCKYVSRWPENLVCPLCKELLVAVEKPESRGRWADASEKTRRRIIAREMAAAGGAVRRGRRVRRRALAWAAALGAASACFQILGSVAAGSSGARVAAWAAIDFAVGAASGLAIARFDLSRFAGAAVFGGTFLVENWFKVFVPLVLGDRGFGFGAAATGGAIGGYLFGGFALFATLGALAGLGLEIEGEDGG